MRHVLHSSGYVNTWSPIRGGVGGGLGGVTWLQEVCYWGWALGDHSLVLLPVCALLLPPLLPTMIDSMPLELGVKVSKLLLLMVFSYSSRQVTTT